MLMISSTCAAKEAKEAKCCSRCTCHIAISPQDSDNLRPPQVFRESKLLNFFGCVLFWDCPIESFWNVKCNACRRYEFRQACRKAGLTFRDAEEAGQPGLVLMVKHDESQNFTGEATEFQWISDQRFDWTFAKRSMFVLGNSRLSADYWRGILWHCRSKVSTRHSLQHEDENRQQTGMAESEFRQIETTSKA